MEDTIHFFPRGVRNPFILKLHTYKRGLIVMDGYWYLEPKTFPVERIMHIDTNAYYVCFTKKVGVEETDKGATEDAPCFFPTGKLELHYTVLQEIKTAKEEKT